MLGFVEIVGEHHEFVEFEVEFLGGGGVWEGGDFVVGEGLEEDGGPLVGGEDVGEAAVVEGELAEGEEEAEELLFFEGGFEVGGEGGDFAQEVGVLGEEGEGLGGKGVEGDGECGGVWGGRVEEGEEGLDGDVGGVGFGELGEEQEEHGGFVLGGQVGGEFQGELR